jgi:hypothetical protein
MQRAELAGNERATGLMIGNAFALSAKQPQSWKNRFFLRLLLLTS